MSLTRSRRTCKRLYCGLPSVGSKQLFNAPTRGVTNAVIQPMAEEAYHAAEKLRQQAFATATDLLQTAEKLNFHLEADKTLDPKGRGHMV